MNEQGYTYNRYVNRSQETRWATSEEIRAAGTYVNTADKTYPVAGLPIMSDGREVYVDGQDHHTIIFGATGSKKTRLFCMPMLNLFAGAGESFIATDPKGELYAKTSGFVRSKGYKIVVLNFRNVGTGDMWNPLYIPYQLYKDGKKEEATSLLNDFVATISAPQMENNKDIFWPQMAQSYALANLMLLMECAKADEANVASLGNLCSAEHCEDLVTLARNMTPDSIAGMNYRGVLTAPERTRDSILSVLYGMVGIFNTQKSLTNMLSGNTMDIRMFGREKTAVYIIMPDEKTTYHFLVTMFIKQVYEILIAEAQSCPGMRLPVRVNFLLDEFCNLPRIPDMPAMISASRSRNMKFFLVAQSLHQLKGRYSEDADTIKGNCENWVFLTSKELALLNEISELCGSVYTSQNYHRRLISVSELQRLDKTKGEALIMHSRQYPFITEFADIDDYRYFKGYDPVPIEAFKVPAAKIFPLKSFTDQVRRGTKKQPFGFKNDKEAEKYRGSSRFGW